MSRELSRHYFPFYIHRMKKSPAWKWQRMIFGWYCSLLIESYDSDRQGYLPNDPVRLCELANGWAKDSPRPRNWQHLAESFARTWDALLSRQFLPTDDRKWVYNQTVLDVLEEHPLKGKRKKPPGDVSLSVVVPEWIPSEAWVKFVLMRIKMRKSLTEDAMRLAVRRLEKLRAEGHSPESVLEWSVLNGYQGLFPPKETDIPVKQVAAKKEPGWAEMSEGERKSVASYLLREKQSIPPHMEVYAEMVKREAGA